MGLRGSRRPTSHIQANSQDEQGQKVGAGGGRRQPQGLQGMDDGVSGGARSAQGWISSTAG